MSNNKDIDVSVSTALELLKKADALQKEAAIILKQVSKSCRVSETDLKNCNSNALNTQQQINLSRNLRKKLTA